MSAGDRDQNRAAPSRVSIVAAVILGAVFVAVVAYRLVSKGGSEMGGNRPVPTISSGGDTIVEQFDAAPLLAALEQPLPRWEAARAPVRPPSRDPFLAEGRFLAALEAAGPGAPAPLDPIPAGDAEAPLLLKGILRDADGPAAYVNDTVLFPGDEISGFVLKQIGQWHVTLEKNGRQLILSLPIKQFVEGTSR